MSMAKPQVTVTCTQGSAPYAHYFCSNFNIAQGGTGEGQVYCITGKVPILLTSIAVDRSSGSRLKVITVRQTLKDKGRHREVATGEGHQLKGAFHQLKN